MLQRILSKLIIFLKAKKIILPPKKNNLIIIDQAGSDKIIDLILKHEECSILDVRGESVNLFILLFSLFYLRAGKYAYKVSYLKYTGAKFAITFVDTSYWLSDLFKFLPSCKLALIQNGRVAHTRFLNIPTRSLKCDYYFVNGNDWGQYAEKYIQAKFVAIGSIIGNSFPIAKLQPVKKIVWVSQYRPPFVGQNTNVPINYNDWTKSDSYALKILEDYCVNNKLSFEILGVLGSNDEFKHYKNIINKFDFVSTNKHSEPYSNYNISNDVIVTGVDSQLQYELFAMGFRTAFFNTRGFFVGNKSYRFAWPHATDDFGLFWANIPDDAQVVNILDFLKHVEEKEWNSLVEENRHVIDYDANNELIRNCLKNENIRID